MRSFDRRAGAVVLPVLVGLTLCLLVPWRSADVHGERSLGSVAAADASVRAGEFVVDKSPAAALPKWVKLLAVGAATVVVASALLSASIRRRVLVAPTYAVAYSWHRRGPPLRHAV